MSTSTKNSINFSAIADSAEALSNKDMSGDDSDVSTYSPSEGEEDMGQKRVTKETITPVKRKRKPTPSESSSSSKKATVAGKPRNSSKNSRRMQSIRLKIAQEKRTLILQPLTKSDLKSSIDFKTKRQITSMVVACILIPHTCTVLEDQLNFKNLVDLLFALHTRSQMTVGLTNAVFHAFLEGTSSGGSGGGDSRPNADFWKVVDFEKLPVDARDVFVASLRDVLFPTWVPVIIPLLEELNPHVLKYAEERRNGSKRPTVIGIRALNEEIELVKNLEMGKIFSVRFSFSHFHHNEGQYARFPACFDRVLVLKPPNCFALSFTSHPNFDRVTSIPKAGELLFSTDYLESSEVLHQDCSMLNKSEKLGVLAGVLGEYKQYQCNNKPCFTVSLYLPEDVFNGTHKGHKIWMTKKIGKPGDFIVITDATRNQREGYDPTIYVSGVKCAVFTRPECMPPSLATLVESVGGDPMRLVDTVKYRTFAAFFAAADVSRGSWITGIVEGQMIGHKVDWNPSSPFKVSCPLCSAPNQLVDVECTKKVGKRKEACGGTLPTDKLQNLVYSAKLLCTDDEARDVNPTELIVSDEIVLRLLNGLKSSELAQMEAPDATATFQAIFQRPCTFYLSACAYDGDRFPAVSLKDIRFRN